MAVAGVAVEGPDGPFEARAGGGVVLASGGFEHDAKLVRTFLRGPLARAVSVPTNTGDALRMAMRVGADRAWGDPAFGYTPQATIGPLNTPPYYATRVRCGALGTKGGPRTDVSGRVLDVDAGVIDGLYAAGNAMGSIMGMTYGGHGGTLGPGLVFGYLAGRDAAARAAACGSGRHGR